jgi:hypothetical protein
MTKCGRDDDPSQHDVSRPTRENENRGCTNPIAQGIFIVSRPTTGLRGSK